MAAPMPVTGSLIFSTQTWMPNPNPQTTTVTQTTLTCEYPLLELSNLTFNVGQGTPMGGSTRSLTLSTIGINIQYSCSYLLSELQTVLSLSTTTTESTTAITQPTTPRTDPTSSDTTKPKPTTEPSHPTSTQTKTLEASIISPSTASGIGIGAFILGLALGLALAACCIFRRRKRSPKPVPSTTHNEEHSAMLTSTVPPLPPAKDLSPPQSNTPRSTAAILPPLINQTPSNSPLHGASDETLTSELAFLGQLIRDHAANNYHLQAVNIDVNLLRQSLGGLNLDEATQDQIAALSVEPHTRYIAIRHLLALSLFSAVDIHYAHGRSLLPAGVGAFIKGLPFDKGGDSRGATTALDTWRRASSYLLHGNTDKHTPLLPGANAKSQIDEFQSALNRFLSNFTHEDSRAVFDQTKNLEGVVQECVVFGYAVFSHPCLWRFTYANQSDSEKTSLVVLPGLEKLSGRDGVVFERAEVVVGPGVVNV